MTFVSGISANSGGARQVEKELRKTLRELDINTSEDGQGNIFVDYTPGSYDPVQVRFSFPDGLGIVAMEAELLPLQDEAGEELRIALNFLNVEVDTYRFYVGEGKICVRHDMIPNLDASMWIHPRELRQVLTGLCAQNAIFADSLNQVQNGKSWRFVKDALKAFR